MSDAYDFKKIEQKWQKIWKEEGSFNVEVEKGMDKFYCLEMLPYPSGNLHMGHVRNYSIGDAIARFRKMRGYNVLHPMGWDSFGMPAENAAIAHGLNPAEWTFNNIDRMREQLKRMGFAYDWRREINTCTPEYYKWNQWLFLKMYEKGLAFRKKGLVNWCPHCKTVLANEQAEQGFCWRCDTQVEERELEQWYLRITDYADDLLNDITLLSGWPENVLTMQHNWIGKSIGARIDFPVQDFNHKISTFTTRIDTIYGATFMVLAPEHPLIQQLIENSSEGKIVLQFVEKQKKISTRERIMEGTVKEGVFTGRYAINPFSQKPMPIWVANFVLMQYGTGAVMGVPGHDQRDFEFAQKYNLSIPLVIQPLDSEIKLVDLEKAFSDYGRLANSGPFNDLSSEEAIEKMTAYLEEKGLGERMVDYRLKDWGISRQRYWGTPIPIILCQKCGIVPVPEEQLPVVLPEIKEIKGEGGSPLEQVEEFANTSCPHCNGPAKRETDTMDTFFDSSWYFIRYTAPHLDHIPIDKTTADYWLPVDLYIGGITHAVMHLMYFRFFTKFLRDIGLISATEPATNLLTQGMVLKSGSAMSKSKGNVVDPNCFIENYGADSMRLFILFAAPPEKDFEWYDSGIEGCYRFLNRLWRIVMEYAPLLKDEDFKEEDLNPSTTAQKLRRKTHQTIRRITQDLEERLHLNTDVSALMELVNQLSSFNAEHKPQEDDLHIIKETLEATVIMLSSFAPHISEELWEKLGKKERLSTVSWPSYDPEIAKEEEVTIVIQINGKLRSRFLVSKESTEKQIKEIAFEDSKIKERIKGKTIVKTIYVPEKLLNIVIK
jgi:leucyl-tRNA synthetase